MDPAAVGLAQKEDREQSIDEQDIFDGVVFFLPTITLLLFTRVLGADDAPFGPVMGKRGEAGTVAGMGTTGVGSSASGVTTVAAPRATPATGRGSTDSLCPGPCRISARAPPGGHRF